MSSELEKTYEKPSLTPAFPYMPKAEWESRIGKARRLMSENGMDAIVILNNQDRLYFFGSGKTYRYGFPYVGIIPREGPTVLIVGSEDAAVVDMEGYVDRLIGYRADAAPPTPTAPEPMNLIVEVMAKELDLGNKTIGMEFGLLMWWDGFNINEWEHVKKELPEAKFVDATDLIWEMRMIKSEWEINTMRHLYNVTCKGFNQIINNAGVGANEKKLFYDALRVWIDEGIIESTNYTLSVMNAVQPFRDRILKEGDWILLDGGPSYKGYTADIQRTIHIGDPGKDGRRAGSSAYKALLATEEILKPGVTAREIWAIGVDTMAKEDPDIGRRVRSRKMPSWAGHGEGLNLHEPPYLAENSDAVIREGMVIAIEIPCFAGKRFINMPEDVYFITKDGFEKLTSTFGPGDIYIRR